MKEERAVLARYDIRRDADGWTVFDIWTGETVVVGAPQTGLSLEAACDLAELLSRRAERGLRDVLQ
ncbi:hypothetical protein [Phenylobacterium sp.]|uniref:hypothetical protein n=1 Tax=Phenylobacterium sp. TaxID=1871053 RepID=UPI002733DE90|nr:hypothetical protein [Phenylobacterium sp.]MDP3660170.1 hypothetical protein [Phenylobacterium sp.]